MKKVVILIDGQNLFYSLKEMELNESQINWTLVFNHFLESGDELARTYWFRPAKLLTSYYNLEKIMFHFVFKNHRGHFDNFKNERHKVPSEILANITEEAKKIEEWIRTQERRFNGIEHAYDQISLEYSDIEIVKKGVVKIDPFKEIYIGEKGVDISLAVKMIDLSVSNRCDKIILVSGDYDYAEAIKFVKDRMMKIHIVKFHKGAPPKNKNMSRDLAMLADRIIPIYQTEIKTHFLKT